MSGSKFVYVIYIRTTPEKLWTALTAPEFTRQYWCACAHDAQWTAGSPWKLVGADGRTFDAGEVLEADAPRRLVLKWRHEHFPELKAEGYSRCTMELEPAGEAVKLTITHEMDLPGSKLIAAISTGWPPILSSLKSLLETGQSLVETRQMPPGM